MAFIAKQRYKLDIAPRGGWVIVYASQHDDGAREIEFEITNQGRTFSIPASINVSVQGIKSNGSYFSHSCSYSGNIVTMALADDMTDIIGKSICVLKFTNSSQQKLATAKFVLNVDTDSSSEGIIIDTEAEEIFNQMLNEIRAQASAISADIAELQSMVGSPLVASTASVMTDHNKIYVYTGSESGYTNGNWYYWNGSAWTSGGVYNSIAINIDSVPTQGSTNAVSSGGVYDGLQDKANLYTNVEYSVENKRVNQAGAIVTSNGCYRTDYYPCVEGTKIKWHGKSFFYQGSSVMCLIAFYDSSKNFISGVTSIGNETTSVEGYVSAIAPANTAFVVGSTNGLLNGNSYFHVFNAEYAKVKDVEQLSESVSKIGLTYIPIAYNGSAISALASKIPFTIKSGEKFTVIYRTELAAYSGLFYIMPSLFNGDTKVDYTIVPVPLLHEDIAYTYIATSNASEIGFYIPAGFPSCIVEVFIIAESSPFEYKVNKNVDAINRIIFDGVGHFNTSDFVRGGLQSGELVTNVTRICTYPTILKYDFPININVDDGYRYGVQVLDDAGNFVSDSGWKTGMYSVPANTPFRIVISKYPDGSNYADINDMISHVYFDTKATALAKATNTNYHYKGESIDFKQKGYNISTLFAVPTRPEGTGWHQGFAIYNNVIVQLYSDNKVTLINYNDGTVIDTLDITSDHGDTIDFSSEFFDANDEFPLAYITSDTTPMKVYVTRITRSSTALIRTYYFGDTSKTGYYAGHCLDSYNNILYTVGYTENSYARDENGTNRMIVAKWDLSNCTTNQDGTLTPTMLNSFTLPFVRTVQGQRYFDNKLFLLSSHNGAYDLPANTTVYVVDPFKQIVTTIFDEFPVNIKNVECEAIEFVLEDNAYDMIISGANYYKLKFS